MYFPFEPPEDVTNADVIKLIERLHDTFSTLHTSLFKITTIENSARVNIRTISTNTVLSDDDFCVIVDTSGGAVTVTLFAGQKGRSVEIKRNGGSNVVIEPDGSETIDGSSSHTLTSDGDSVLLRHDGSNWFIL